MLFESHARGVTPRRSESWRGSWPAGVLLASALAAATVLAVRNLDADDELEAVRRDMTVLAKMGRSRATSCSC